MKTIDLRAVYTADPERFRSVIREYVDALSSFTGPEVRFSTALQAEIRVPRLRHRKLELAVQAGMLTKQQRQLLTSEARRGR